MGQFPQLDEVPNDGWPALVEENAVEGCRVWSDWPKLKISEERGILYTFSQTGFALFNNVLRSQIDADEFTQRCECVLARYREAGQSMLWWTGPATQPEDTDRRLKQAGLNSLGKTFGMVVDLSKVDDTQAPPDDLQIVEVDDLNDLRRWADIMTSVYAFPEFARPLWFELHAALGLGSNQPWRHFLANYRGQPAATASLFAGRQSAAVANVATLPEFRRIGLGRAITLATICAAGSANYRIGTLYSSPEAAGIYRSLGFREVCHAECFSWTLG